MGKKIHPELVENKHLTFQGTALEEIKKGAFVIATVDPNTGRTTLRNAVFGSEEEEKETEEAPCKIADTNIGNYAGGMEVKFKKDTSNTQWQPTPGELIEVSNDDEEEKEWKTVKFVGMRESLTGRVIYYYGNYKDEDGMDCITNYRYARPLQEKLPEVIVPEFDYMKHVNQVISMGETGWEQSHRLNDRIGMQTEKITQWIHSQSQTK